MIIAKSNTYGLDTQIRKIQGLIENNLSWIDTVGSEEVLIYGQIQKLKNNEGTFDPNVHVSNKDYTEAFFNDKKSAIVGFIVSEDVTYGSKQFTTDIDVVFTFNIKEVHADSTNNTERSILEGLDSFKNQVYINEITGIKKGVDNVFSGFDLEGIEFSDIFPNYCFSISINVSYLSDLCLRTEPVTGDLLTADNNVITTDNNSITLDQIRI